MFEEIETIIMQRTKTLYNYNKVNMTKEEILRLRDTAEQTRVQFKERVTRDNKYDVSCEMVAQSNSRGGMIVVGIDDKTGRINPLSFVEVQETTNLLGSLA